MPTLEEKISSKQARIALVGFGYIGTCIGVVLAQRGYIVTGVDVRKNIVDEINNGTTSIAEPGLAELVRQTVAAGTLTATTDFAAIAPCDVIIVTVGTPLGKEFEPDMSHITAAAKAMQPHLREGQLVILKSTVPPFTTERVVKPILDTAGVEYRLAFCPERLAEGHAIVDLTFIPIVVGGVDAASSEASVQFFTTALGVETIALASAHAAELVKLADNLWIDLNIALANEIAMLSDRIGVDALEVIAAANTLPKGKHMVNILFPSVGVGGYCLTKDPWFVHHLGAQLGLDLKTPFASRTANDRMPEYSFRLIEAALGERGKTLQESKVAVLGLSFKNNTGDCRYSPTKGVIELLAKSGCTLQLYDPWVSDAEALHVTEQKLNRDLANTLASADAVVFLTGHDEFKAITAGQLQQSLKAGALIFDGRNMMSADMIAALRVAGFAYRGVGR